MAARLAGLASLSDLSGFFDSAVEQVFADQFCELFIDGLDSFLEQSGLFLGQFVDFNAGVLDGLQIASVSFLHELIGEVLCFHGNFGNNFLEVSGQSVEPIVVEIDPL